MNIIRSILGTTAIPIFDDLSAPMVSAILAQQSIGYSNMVFGFLAMEWTAILEKLGVEHPQARSEMLMALRWDDICKSIWKARYNIKHDMKNFSTLDEMSSLAADKLMFYHRHQDEVLDIGTTS